MEGETASKVVHPADAAGMQSSHQPLQQHSALVAPRNQQGDAHADDFFEDSDIMVCCY